MQGVEGVDYVVCRVCCEKRLQITFGHLKTHGISFDEYREMFPGAKLTSDIIKQKVADNHADFSGGNNPNYGLERSAESKLKTSLSTIKRYEDPAERLKTSLSLIGKERLNMRGRSHPNYSEEVPIDCEQCGGTFYVKPGEAKTRRFCSPECANIANTGHEVSEEVRQAQRERMLGSHMSMDTRIKLSCYNRGIPIEDFDGFASGHPNVTCQDIGRWRKSVFERDDYTCQMCDVRGGNLNAHHIYPRRHYPDPQFSLNPLNGITLCVKCHRETFGKEYDFISEFLDITMNVNTRHEILISGTQTNEYR